MSPQTADLLQMSGGRSPVHSHSVVRSANTPCRTLQHKKLEKFTNDSVKSGLCNEISSEKKDYIYQKITSDQDFHIVYKSLRSAEESCWYYGDYSSTEAKALLKQQSHGTFIMRNSSDPKYLFSLSVKTERGPTSVRIRYSHGLFQMDCEDHLKNKLPKFDNVVGLIDFHISLYKSRAYKDCRWLERSGRRDMMVTLTQPRRRAVPSLQHLCRLSVNASLQDKHIPERSTHKLPVPRSIQAYLEEYPYTV